MLLSLIGEQPIPVLLVDRALQPARHILAHSERTRRVAENLRALLPHAQLLPLADAYDLEGIRAAFEQVYQPGMTFNLTGGTKPMAWAGYEVARSFRAEVAYLESEKKQSKLYRLNFTTNGMEHTADVLPRLISPEDYLQAHGLQPVPSKPSSNEQETALFMFLRTQADEVRHNLQYPAFEIDFLVQRGNQAAVIEAKSGLSQNKRKRDGLDQLTTIAGREYLGTYTGRIWVVAKMPGEQLQKLAKAYGIQVVLVSIREAAPGKWRLDEASQNRLRAALDETLGPQSAI
ncbi:MAG TPA: DUF1887 family CARF protein [Anaerolineales bacterium]|nr:DUF1887 family CARF protein [Anaerolineales bacterium]